MTIDQTQQLISGVNQSRSLGINDSVEILRYLTKTEITGYDTQYITGSKYPDSGLAQMETTYTGLLKSYGLNVGAGVGQTMRVLHALYTGNQKNNNIQEVLTINANSQILSNTYFYFDKLGIELNGNPNIITENKTALYSLPIIDFEINVGDIEGIK